MSWKAVKGPFTYNSHLFGMVGCFTALILKLAAHYRTEVHNRLHTDFFHINIHFSKIQFNFISIGLLTMDIKMQTFRIVITKFNILIDLSPMKRNHERTQTQNGVLIWVIPECVFINDVLSSQVRLCNQGLLSIV